MDQYAVIGNPIVHSKSPVIHRMFAQQCAQQLEYTALLSDEKNFISDVTNFFLTGKGMNVTVPFKIQAKNFAHELSERAEQAGAVNTLIKHADGRIVGENTDGVGLVNDLLRNQRVDLNNKTVVLIGAGGATQGVLFPLLQQQTKEIIIANRTLEKARNLSKSFSRFGKTSAISLDALAELETVDIIINASSAGLSGVAPPLPENLEHCFCYDMIYSKELTPFLSASKESGCSNFSDGLGMLVEQAAESFLLWRGMKPETAPVLKALKAHL